MCCTSPSPSKAHKHIIYDLRLCFRLYWLGSHSSMYDPTILYHDSKLDGDAPVISRFWTLSSKKNENEYDDGTFMSLQLRLLSMLGKWNQNGWLQDHSIWADCWTDPEGSWGNCVNLWKVKMTSFWIPWIILIVSNYFEWKKAIAKKPLKIPSILRPDTRCQGRAQLKI